MNTRRGQSTAEYAVVISVVIACVIGMQLYVKRGMQVNVKHVTDVHTQHVGSGPDALSAAGVTALEQYEPYYTADGTFTQTVDNKQHDQKLGGGIINITAIDQKTTRKSQGDVTQGGAAAVGVEDAAWR